ncbi:exonuclease SbcCD subunit D [Kineococcus gynurae]|uniref:Exonuclease SbcCD subunit D n=1 Tax=Kineococcus gynurae TaxID=452979 RepID=A0ABV5LT75_9ACTN
MRFVHAADLQLGMTRHFLDADAQPRFTAARTEALARALAVAREAGAEFVVVCGDVLESNAVGPRVLGRALQVMAEGGVPVFLLPGNHDPLDAASPLTSAAVRDAANVHVLDRAGVHEVRPGVEIVAAPWTSKHPEGDLVAGALAAAGDPAPGTVRIVVGHGAVDELSPDREDPARIALAPLEAAIAAGTLHYVALGDRHSTTQVGTSGAVWYSGTPEVTDRRETAPGNVLVVEVSDGVPPKVEEVRVGTWSFPLLAADLEDRADVESLLARLARLPRPDRTVVTLQLTGSLSLGDNAFLEDELDRAGHLLAGLRVWDRHSDLVVRPEPGEVADLGIGGFADPAIAELGALAGGEGPRARAARDALSLLFRLAGGGRPA